MMKIVFLDSLSLGNKDLSRFEKFGDFIEYRTTSKEQLAERILDADIIITNKVYLGKEELSLAKNLKLICISATGINNVDISVAKKMNIKVINVKDYSTESVAQMAITYMLNLSASLIDYNNLSKTGEWANSPIFTKLSFPFSNLKGKKLGIIGYGAIGKRVEQLARVFGMDILISERPGNQLKRFDRISFEEVLENSDFITIHTPLDANTKNLFNIDTFRKMKSSAFLINTARGPIINEEDFYIALKNNIIAGGAIDVMTVEPPKEDNPLFTLNNLIITPHIAWASDESISKLLEGVEKNITDFFNGQLESL